nr:MAG TPA: regulatory protein [Caudoviricetes sp.]
MTNMDIPKLPVKLVFSKDIHTYTGFSLRWIYTLEQRGQFPKRIRLGPRRFGWDAEEVAEWQNIRKNIDQAQ